MHRFMLLSFCLLTGAVAADPHAAARAHLPDHSAETAGRLGPFLWTRAADAGGDARFCDRHGGAQPDGDHLWLYQFTRLARTQVSQGPLLERNNLESLSVDLAYGVQFRNLIAHCPQPHNFKLVIGYKQQRSHFKNGDNADLAHLVQADRICAYIPVRKRADSDPTNPENYYFNAAYAGQSFCIVEFKAGEMIQYEWFRDPDRLDPHILCDLAPLVADSTAWTPGVLQPMFRLNLLDAPGGWEFLIEQDGRDGLAGGVVDGDWDYRFTHESPGAKAASVDVTRANSRWALSTFSPGGAPEDSSELLIGLTPYDRDSQAIVAWPERSVRIRNAPIDSLLAGETDYRKLKIKTHRSTKGR